MTEQQTHRSIFEDFDRAPIESTINYDGEWPWPFYVTVTQGVMRVDEGLASTWGGARRKQARMVRRARRIQARKLGYDEVQETPAQRWEAAFNA